MNSILRDALTALILGAVVPGIFFNVASHYLPGTRTELVSSAVEETALHTFTPILVRISENEITNMDMDAYLVGVVLAEMPASFETEALKAQAVVARTYACKADITGGKHGDGSICTKPSCCQAYLSEKDFLDRGGTKQSVMKVKKAVEATSGKILTYEGAPIEATYFSCSGGYTEDAVSVWGTDYPYLRSVSSPGEEGADHFTDVVYFTTQVFCSLLGQWPEGKPSDWFSSVVYTEGGGVDSMTIGKLSYSGVELRSRLGLRSTAFYISTDDNEIAITTKGYGHRVGLSQYGANAMAMQGNSYEDILSYYYQNTILSEKVAE